MKKKKIFVPYNFNLDSIINPKIVPKKKIKNTMIISPIPISISKNKFKQSINFQKKESLANKLFFNFALIKPNKDNENNFSTSKEKSKEENSNEYLKANDFNSLKKNLEVIKIEIEMRNKMLKDNKINIDKLTKDLEELNIIKNNKENLLEDNLSKKETLEEMCNNVINNIKSNNYLNNENYYIEITLEEIKKNNIDSFINKVYKVFKYINNFIDNKYYNFIYTSIKHSYSDFFSNLTNNKSPNESIIINNFFHNISLPLSINILSKTAYKSINILLHFLLKINYISESINENINFLEKEYKTRKNYINEEIKNFENKLKIIQAKKNELIELKNDINEKIVLLSQKKSPFCERVIGEKSLIKKELTLNNISSIIPYSTEVNNKSNSNSISKYRILTYSSNKKDKNNDFTQGKKLIFRNMVKFLNKKNNTDEYHTYHSNKISEAKIYINKISNNCSTEKNHKQQKKINIKDINKKIFRIPQNKQKQNGSNIEVKERNKINKKIKQLSNFHNNTEIEFSMSPNLIQVNKVNMKKVKDKDNGKKEYSNKIIKTERDIERIKNITKITVNSKDNKNNKNLINDYFKNIKKDENNLSKVFSLCKNISFEKKRSPTNIIKGYNLFKYLTKRDNGNNSNGKNIPFKKIRKNCNNLITNKIKSKNKTLNEGLTNRKKNKNSYNSYNTFEKQDKSEIKINKIIKKNLNSNNNSFESFCYYKQLDKDSKLFNPLNNNINLNKLGYNEGFISIDTNLNCIKIDSNNIISNNINNSYYISNYENNNFAKSENISYMNKSNELNIKLKDVTKVYLNKLMKNIVKIHNIFLKYNISNKNDKDKSNKKFTNINKLLNVREILNIKDMEQSEKIKAGLCNFFSFIIEFGNNTILEFILINFNQFNTWLNYLEDIVNNNIKTQKYIANGNNSDDKNNGIVKLKSFYSKIKCMQIDKVHRSVTEKKKQKNYDCLK